MKSADIKLAKWYDVRRWNSKQAPVQAAFVAVSGNGFFTVQWRHSEYVETKVLARQFVREVTESFEYLDAAREYDRRAQELHTYGTENRRVAADTAFMFLLSGAPEKARAVVKKWSDEHAALQVDVVAAHKFMLAAYARDGGKET